MNKILGLFLLLASLVAHADDKYVNNVTGNLSYDGTSPVHTTGNVGPWLNPKCSVGNVSAGTTVHLAYTGVPYTVGIFCTSNAGTANSPIVFDGGDPATGLPPYANISVSSGQAVQVQGNASYIIFQHLFTENTATNGADFFIGSSGFAGTVHHISIRFNIMAFAGGSCVQMEFADFVTTHDNSIYNCGSTSNPASTSNISYLAPTVPTGDTGATGPCYDMAPDIQARYGTAYRLCIYRNYIFAGYKGTGAASDGNNIIADDFRCSQFPSTNCMGVNYGFAILIVENVTFSADARNIHGWLIRTTVGMSRFAYNVAYNACQGGGSPCSSTTGAVDCLGNSTYKVTGCQIDHNIIYAPLSIGYPVDISFADGGSFIVSCNILFGGLAGVHTDGSAGAGLVQVYNITSNPNLANPSTSPQGADWRTTGSTPSLAAACASS